MSNPNIVFIGDCVFDLFSYVDRMPKMGETLNSNGFKYGTGGKAANACVAASRLSSTCSFIGKVGDDLFGNHYIKDLKNNNVKTDYISLTTQSVTSCASVMVDKNGYNAIVVNNATNYLLGKEDVKNAQDLIKNSNILVTNTLIALDAALYAMKLAKENKALTILNFSALKNDIKEEENEYIDILVVNEIEAEGFSGIPVSSIDDAKKVATALLDKPGLNVAIIITLGEKGVVWSDKKTRKVTYVPCEKVNVVDTTGAGDAFVGALSHYILKLGVNSLDKCVELACAYATISVQSPGTQTSYPYLDAIDKKFAV